MVFRSADCLAQAQSVTVTQRKGMARSSYLAFDELGGPQQNGGHTLANLGNWHSLLGTRWAKCPFRRRR